MMEAPQLTDQDLHCIARLLQSARNAPGQGDIPAARIFYGCWYCKYSHDCRSPSEMHYKTAMKKLGWLTGVSVWPAQECLEKTFLPASVFIRHPEELEYLGEYHPGRYPHMKKYLERLTGRSQEALEEVKRMAERTSVNEKRDREREMVKMYLFDLLKRAAGDDAAPGYIRIAPEVAALLLEIT